MATATGCSLGSQIKLTDNEGQEIAEYVAHLMLKYDKNYKPTLMYREDYDAEVKAREKALEKAQAEEEAKKAAEEAAAKEEEAKDDKSDKDKADTPSKSESYGEEEVQPVSYSLNEVFGVQDVEVSFAGSTIEDEYKMENEFFSIKAPEGKKLVVCKFAVVNLKDEEQTIDTGKLKLSYKLGTGSGPKLEAKTSLLENDIQFLNVSIEASGTYEAVVLFFADQSVVAEDMTLYVSSADKETKIAL